LAPVVTEAAIYLALGAQGRSYIRRLMDDVNYFPDQKVNKIDSVKNMLVAKTVPII